MLQVSAADYAAAKPDPVAAFAAPVCGHMNADHEGDIQAMVKHYIGVTATSAKMLDLDRLGFNLQVGAIQANVLLTYTSSSSCYCLRLSP